MLRIIFILLFINNFLFSCCCYPKASCVGVAFSTKTTSLLSKKAISINDTKLFATNLRRINKTLGDIDKIENEILKYRDYLNALKNTQLLLLNEINKLMSEINYLKISLINSYMNLHTSISIYNKILLYQLINEQSKKNYKELMEFVNGK